VDWYLYLKALHIIAIIVWMAGLFYLPRLYVYHVDAAPGSEMSETFKVMEQRLLRIIMNPALIASWVVGLILMFGYVDLATAGWLHAKLLLVVVMSGFHGFLAKCRKDFAADRNSHSSRYYRLINEIPTLLLIFIVFLAVVKPF
jgi:putative membrane protein